MGVLSLLPLPPSFPATEVAVAVMVTRALLTRLAGAQVTRALLTKLEGALVTLVLDVQVVVKLVELAAFGFVIMVCNSAPATGNVMASGPVWHGVAALAPHHQWTPEPVVSRYLAKFTHPSDNTVTSGHVSCSSSISKCSE